MDHNLKRKYNINFSNWSAAFRTLSMKKGNNLLLYSNKYHNSRSSTLKKFKCMSFKSKGKEFQKFSRKGSK